MEQFLKFFKDVADRYKELSPDRKAIALVLAAAGLASVFVMFLWAQAPDHQLLFANLSSEDAAAVVDELKTRNIEYDLTNQGRSVWVPSRQVHETRLALASKGIPAGSEVGFELFEDIPLGMTEFVQKLNFQRALQGELTRTIKSLDAIDQARVHLVIPKADLFVREKPKGKASVMVKVKPGKILSENQVQGIVHLVSGSVESIQAQDVVVVDLKGNILSGAGGASQGAIITATNFEHKRKVEKELEDNIVKMLEEALGTGKVIARVSAKLNFEKEEKTEEIYDPDSQVVRSEQTTTESALDAVPAGGVPGSATLLPSGANAGAGAAKGLPATREKEKNTFNYEINKVVRHVTKPAGEIIHLSVGVLIDGVYSGDPPVYRKRPAEEMAKYFEIVKSVVGFDASRNDQIKVENVQFDKSLLREIEQQLAAEEKYRLAFEVAKYLLGAIFVILLFFMIIRPLIRWVTKSVEVVRKEPPALPPEKLEALETEEDLARLSSEAAEIRKAVTSFVEQDPQRAAGILRKWMRERTPV